MKLSSLRKLTEQYPWLENLIQGFNPNKRDVCSFTRHNLEFVAFRPFYTIEQKMREISSLKKEIGEAWMDTAWKVIYIKDDTHHIANISEPANFNIKPIETEQGELYPLFLVRIVLTGTRMEGFKRIYFEIATVPIGYGVERPKHTPMSRRYLAYIMPPIVPTMA